MIVVTGAAGFIGARFVRALGTRFVPIVSVDHLQHFDARTEHAGIDFGERVEPDGLLTWLAGRSAGVDAVVHLGACTDTREQDRAYLSRVNVEFSQAIWRHCARARIPLVYASSAATYGDGSLGYDDDEQVIPRLRPLNRYGESKQQLDLWALGQDRAGSRPPAWCGLKFFNVYGFGERHKGPMASVVLHAFDQIVATGQVRLFKSHRPDVADGHQARDFVFVDDVVDVLARLVERPVDRGIFNLGSGRARTFLDLARAVFSALGVPERIEFIDTPEDVRRHYQYFTEARMERLRAAGYDKPFTSLEDGVTRYVGLLRQGAPALDGPRANRV
jgi:ADP-L-glycero-D-manno-heptose 6-epimerase